MRKKLLALATLVVIFSGCRSSHPGAKGQASSQNSSDSPSANRDGSGNDGPGTMDSPFSLADFPWPTLQTSLPDWSLAIAPADLDLLNRRLDRSLRVPATFMANGVSYAVTTGYRGQSSMNFPKKSFEIEFPKSNLFEGRHKIILLAEWKDGGYLTTKLWNDLALAYGVRMPRTSYVNLTLNDGYYGIMVDIEPINKGFLANHRFDGESDIYRSGQNDSELRDMPADPDQKPWEKKTNKDQPWDELWNFLHQVNRTEAANLVAFLESNFELAAYIRWLAVDAAISNQGVEDSRSYVIFDPVTRRWTYVPWDLNNALSLYSRKMPIDRVPPVGKTLLNYSAYDPNVPHFSVLNTRLVDDNGLRERYANQIEHLLQTRFTEAEIGSRVDAMSALLSKDIARDPYVDREYAARSADYLKQYVRSRSHYIKKNLPNLRDHGNTALKVDQVGLDTQGHAFVQIVNTSTLAADLSGLHVTGQLRATAKPLAPSVSLPPGGQIVLTEGASDPLQSLPVTIDRTYPEFGLYDAQGRIPIDLMILPPLVAGKKYGRVPSGSENFADSAAP